MSHIAIVDYGMGNLRSVYQALEHVSKHTTITVTADKQIILDADRVVFPGQGAARDCMRELANHDLLDIIPQVAQEKPFLGVCMGMQVLMEHSAENDGIDCLGIYQGAVLNFTTAHQQREDQNERLKIPQMGWNQIVQQTDHPLWHGIDKQARFYFVHSYYVQPADDHICTGMTDYGLNYASAIAQDNIFAIQAHPEKSADDGLQLLKNFTQWDGVA